MSQAGSQVSGAQSAFQPTFYPGFAPQPFVRGPSYNERYVAWKNRQKAFNKYKKMTRRAIKSQQTFVPQQFGYGAPYGTVFPGTVFPGQGYSFASQAVDAAPAAEGEAEIRGTQV